MWRTTYVYAREPLEIQVQKLWNVIRHSMTALLPMLQYTSITPLPLSRFAFIPTSKIWCTFKKCHYFNFLALRQNCEK